MSSKVISIWTIDALFTVVESVEKSSARKSLELLEAAISELVHLKGVGPATASAVLVLVRPDVFCYMYDEVIDCFLPNRTYTMTVYMKVNMECRKIARHLEGWTPARVAQALWIAARLHAAGEDDYTVVAGKSCSSRKRVATNSAKSGVRTTKQRTK